MLLLASANAPNNETNFSSVGFLIFFFIVHECRSGPIGAGAVRGCGAATVRNAHDTDRNRRRRARSCASRRARNHTPTFVAKPAPALPFPELARSHMPGSLPHPLRRSEEHTSELQSLRHL